MSAALEMPGAGSPLPHNPDAEMALLGAVLRLPPLKQALANEQMRSRFVAAVTRRG